MKKVVFFFLGLPLFSMAQNNLIDSSTWTVGSGAAPGFSIQGTVDENVREMGIGPQGTSVLLWKSVPNGSSGYDGGWKTNSFVAVDHTKEYRFSIWIKKTNSNTGTTHFGLFADQQSSGYATLRLNGTVVNNAYFFSSDLPQLDQWYLLVGFVHASGDPSTVHKGRIYDTSGNEISALIDFKFTSDAYSVRHRSFLYQDTNTSDSQYYWDPTVYEVNGQEPTILQLIQGGNGGDTQAPSSPTLSSSSPTENTVDLSWSGATDNVGVTGYKVFKDNALEATLGNVTNYQVTGLSASTTYQFKLRALDAAGNESVDSNSISITTDAGSGNGNNGGGGSVWSENNAVASYSGEVAIGRSTVPSGYQMAVEGKIRTREVRVDQENWPDYVFKENYELIPLERLQEFIEENGHLPNVPSAKEVEQKGMPFGKMDRLLLEKIEELTLYLISLESENEVLQKTLWDLGEQTPPAQRSEGKVEKTGTTEETINTKVNKK